MNDNESLRRGVAAAAKVSEDEVVTASSTAADVANDQGQTAPWWIVIVVYRSGTGNL